MREEHRRSSSHSIPNPFSLLPIGLHPRVLKKDKGEYGQRCFWNVRGSMLTTVRDDSYDFAILAYSFLGDIVLQVHLSFSRYVHDV
jgi:hypothetical protein